MLSFVDAPHGAYVAGCKCRTWSDVSKVQHALTWMRRDPAVPPSADGPDRICCYLRLFKTQDGAHCMQTPSLGFATSLVSSSIVYVLSDTSPHALTWATNKALKDPAVLIGPFPHLLPRRYTVLSSSRYSF